MLPPAPILVVPPAAIFPVAVVVEDAAAGKIYQSHKLYSNKGDRPTKYCVFLKISDGIGVQEAIFLPSTLFVQNLGWSEVTSRIIGLKD